MKKRKAFTLTELIVAIIVMAITYAAMNLSSSTAKQTAQHEAERLAAYLYRTIQKADMVRLQKGFTIDTDFETNSDGSKRYRITVHWQTGTDNYEKFMASAGCKYADNFPGDSTLTYNVKNKRFKGGGTITVTDSEGENYYVIIAVDEGRIRLSETPPD